MRKILSLSIALLIAASQTAYAKSESELQVSNSPSFSSENLNFNAGDTIYVRVVANSTGTSRHDLNLRDNNYNLIHTYNLSNSTGNTFTGNITAPSSEGYYSLEAKIESNGADTTSVKTIKVGNGSNANVHVDVNSNSNSSNSTTQNRSSNLESSLSNGESAVEETSGQNPDNGDISENQNVVLGEKTQNPQKESKIKAIIIKILSIIQRKALLIWPF